MNLFHKEFIYHIAFWLLFMVLWSVHDLVFHDNFIELFMGNCYTMSPYIPLVYFNLYVLVPRLLLKKKLLPYLLAIGACILIITLFSSWNNGYYYAQVKNITDTADFFLSSQGKIALLTEILVLVGLTMTIYLARAWYQKERYAQEIEQKRLESELHLLKSQINPHFLFNSLNSIFVMLDKDLQSARNMLLQVSEILSHQLYETSKERILLGKDIENLKNYIEIEKKRHEDLATVDIHLPENVNGQQIAPMLLLPIVENAFKHGQSSDGYWINIHMQLASGSQLIFNVTNSYKPKIVPNHKQGIGLSNLRRRLELIYPEDYILDIRQEDETFTVNLKLSLND